MKKIILVVWFGILSCQTSQQSQVNEKTRIKEKNRKPITKSKGYPYIIDSLGLQKKYDETKWKVYLVACNDTPKTETGTYLMHPPLPFGYYDLAFDSLNIKSDTLAFYFDFVDDKGEPVSLIKYRDMKNPQANGLLFYPRMSPFSNCFVSNHSSPWLFCLDADRLPLKDTSRFKAYYDSINDAFAYPLQSEVIQYINENKSTLNPWLVKEALKRGVLK